ncbi:site-specific DNA-methyltransferase [Corynebacterium sp. HS2168-gen11]|uniref:site-specific DNA-methyltransferase n=1 Tax=Corynebacterium sp. HS2168-gen11 TaxID=2974027 RepID=UPI00216B59AF|nr:site-specific DNA-methyltransferase [Corynebacterium sp. HS2168-gen11]MCS4535790.1 site-specific DNA-methyltransferase [Corynebacterium sp. HS2168-gen11]
MTEILQKIPHTTPDFTSDAAAKLADLFPEAIADGKINLDIIKTILGSDVEDTKERFGLTWQGKAQAIRAAQSPTTATLAPDYENSVDWDTTQNVFIEGDNLEVLKILQKHYYGQIKMIYIDPPYNTGNDFVYQDDYKDGIGAYLEMTGQADESGRLSTNQESAGRFHSNWLNMMYPRLKLARNLLREDGVIFISIDNHELTNLTSLCNQIFGESNHLNTFTWVSNLKGRQISKSGAAVTKEYILCYARSAQFVPEFKASSEELKRLMPDTYKGFNYEILKDAKSPFVIKNELYNTNPAFNEETRPNLVFDIYFNPETGEVKTEEVSDSHLHADFVKISPHTNSNGKHKYHAFRWSREKIARETDDLYFVRKSESWKVYTKVRDIDGTIVKDLITGLSTSTGSTDITKLGMASSLFDYPKPVALIKLLVSLIATDHDIVLDFFAGSGTTAHAVMQLNAEDGGTRRCISVQLPESTPEKSEARKAGFETISEITRERIRRAGKKILEDESSKLDGRADSLDVGFRAYKLVDTNFTKWKADSTLSENELVDLFAKLGDSADDNARPEALLTELLLKLGFSLSEKIDTVEIAGLNVFKIADNSVIAYMDEHTKPTLDQMRALVACEPVWLVILEDCFSGDDELKTNLKQECDTHDVKLRTA